MPVATFVQPNFTVPAQTASVYKAAIDAAIAVLATVGADYACHAKATPDMQVQIDAGQLFLANSTLVSNAQQTSATIVAPVGNPRIDRIVINDQTGVGVVVTGVVAASPVAPAILAGTRPIAQILLQTSSVVIANSMITDERVVVTFDVSTYIRTLLLAVDAPAARATLIAAALAGLSTQNFAANALTVDGLITANGGQIKFPATQNPSANANTLDDYEEGSFTAQLRFGGNSVGMTFTAMDGNYTKIGRLVTFSLGCWLTAKGSSTGAASIAGVPFTIQEYGSASFQISQITFVGQAQVVLPNSGTIIFLQQITEAGVLSGLTDANFVNASQLNISGHYWTT